MRKKLSSGFRGKRLLDERVVEYLTGIFATRHDVSTAVRDGLQQMRERVKEEVLGALAKDLWASSISDIEKFIDLADEVTATKTLVVPLFKSMGYERVRADPHQHRSLEFGQDIREMKLRLPSGHTLYFVAQVKKHAIRSSTARVSVDVEAVILQLEKSTEKKVFDYEFDAEVRPDHAYLVVLGRMSKDARLFLEERIAAEKRRKILIVDKEDLLGLCKQYGLPLDAQAAIRQYITEHTGKMHLRGVMTSEGR
jgi:hypothetical protein